MFKKLIIGLALVLVMQMFLTAVVSGRRYGCVEGFCAMEDCPSSSGSGRTNFCWIAKKYRRNRLECAGKEECRQKAEADGTDCVLGSCNFDRAPDPYAQRHKTCEFMNAENLEKLKEECQEKSWDHWTRIYSTPNRIFRKFDPCFGDGRIIDGETKKVISHCHCYNFCGSTQTTNGDCEVTGLDRSLDHDADISTTYRAVCKIDCEPTDKLDALKILHHQGSETANMKVTITRGMSAAKSFSSGGSTSITVSGEVAVDVLGVFTAKIGVSGTTGYDWSHSTTTNSFEQVSHEISVPVKAGDEVTVYQVVGECENTDGTTYTVKSPKYVIKGKDGETQDTGELE
ncbi:uncharacterized protein LOC144656356 [Oculina patagonica]